MKKLIIMILVFSFVFACSEPDDLQPTPSSNIPLELNILSPVGIKLESNFVTTEAKMNVKLSQADKVTIKIIDISGKTVSSETIDAKEGDNLLTVYTKALPRSSYQLQLYNSENQQIAKTLINLL